MLFDYWVGGRSGHTHTRQADFQLKMKQKHAPKKEMKDRKKLFSTVKRASPFATHKHTAGECRR